MTYLATHCALLTAKIRSYFLICSSKGWVLIFLYTLCISWAEGSIPADLSFLVVDFKYSQQEGIKICEVQQGVLSAFMGFSYLHKTEGYLEKRLTDYLLNKQENLFVRKKSVPNKTWLEIFEDRGVTVYEEIEDLAKDPLFQSAVKPLADFSCIDNYPCWVIITPPGLKKADHFQQDYPGALILDNANHPYWIDKYKMSLLFRDDPILEDAKPRWNLYPKQYTSELAQEIIEELTGELFVIKPRGAFLGNGVLIVEKQKLDETLKLILEKNPMLIYAKDSTLSYWLKENSDSFIVEQFFSSDPILWNNKEYDGTIRSVIIMSYNHGIIDLEFIDHMWKLPPNALSEKGTLNQKHKSCGKVPYFAPIDTEVQKNIEFQLKEVLQLLYKRMLGV